MANVTTNENTTGQLMRGLLNAAPAGTPTHNSPRYQYIFGGHAIFTLHNPATSARFTYKVSKHETDPIWFVALLNGPDNTSNYMYMGLIGTNGAFRLTKASKAGAAAPSVVAFQWLLGHMENPRVEVWHEGVCCRCGRTLTVPESIANGIGPTCASKGGAQ